MKQKLSVTKLVSYRCEHKVPASFKQPKTARASYSYYRGAALQIPAQRFRITPKDMQNDELYSIRNQYAKSHSSYIRKAAQEWDEEIDKRKAVHPLLKEATPEEVTALKQRITKNAVTAAVLNEQKQHYIDLVFKDIERYEKYHESNRH